MTSEYDGVLYVQYYHLGEIYYRYCEIYGDDPDESEEAIEMLANSSELWPLCGDAPPLQGRPLLSLCSEMEYKLILEYDRQVMEKNQRLVYKGLLDNCNDIGITEAELQEA